MKKLLISNERLAELNDAEPTLLPKYVSQLINWANQNAQGTRPRVVGQMTELFPEFIKETNRPSHDAWQMWYSKNFPDAVTTATDKIYAQVNQLKQAIIQIDREMVESWVKDLIFSKTYNGMYVQEAILAEIADQEKKSYRLATSEEEAKGIDGHVGSTAYSIKPSTYKTMRRLPEQIDVTMVYYEKTKKGLTIEIMD